MARVTPKHTYKDYERDAMRSKSSRGVYSIARQTSGQVIINGVRYGYTTDKPSRVFSGDNSLKVRRG